MNYRIDKHGVRADDKYTQLAAAMREAAAKLSPAHLAPARNPLDESQEQLGPVELGQKQSWWHWAYPGNPMTFCGTHAPNILVGGDNPAQRGCPDCCRIRAARGQR